MPAIVRNVPNELEYEQIDNRGRWTIILDVILNEELFTGRVPANKAFLSGIQYL